MNKLPIRIGVVLQDNVLNGKEAAFEYLLLKMNSMQTSIEFSILPTLNIASLNLLFQGVPVDRIEFENSVNTINEAYENHINQQALDFAISAVKPDSITVLSTATFTDNFFATGGSNWDVLALGNWERHMAPPSIVEYFLSYTVRFAIDTACGDYFPSRHYETKGCIFDFSSALSNSRYGVLTGFLCSDCRNHVEKHTSKNFTVDAIKLLEKKWLGTVKKRPTSQRYPKSLVMTYSIPQG